MYIVLLNVFNKAIIFVEIIVLLRSIFKVTLNFVCSVRIKIVFSAKCGGKDTFLAANLSLFKVNIHNLAPITIITV